MGLRNFEELEVWKRGCQLAVDIYTALHTSKDFGLKDQMQRAAVSIASNIAEGSERASTQEYIRFLRISKSSCAELRTQLYIYQKAKKATGQPALPDNKPLIQETREISAMLQGLIKSLQAKQ
ncbi:four helix bundle protein [Rubritalea squalenifaciens DSM 18772]|uniref:Four helix bundle protein n=2 Tax=Rubritalea TaxID=361050 RepID=A0A1M6KXW5_9BACT|nr:four helix bundle protein [Rubritalea squalenifaciens]SHJ63813.1 four helix bundle protein [Rubritalea squalenifaciens DSM 18772]